MPPLTVAWLKLTPQQRSEARSFAHGELWYQKGLRSFEIHEWVFLEGSMTVTLNFAKNTCL